jgi:sulfatase modifying factor 1
MFAFGGRRGGRPTALAGRPDAGSEAHATSSLDSLASVAVPEPAVRIPAERGTAPGPAQSSGAEQPYTPPLAVAPFDTAQARKHQETWAKHLGIEVETTNSIGQRLIVIPPGKFKMGDGDATVGVVTLTKPFLLGETEVTQGQWREVMGTEPWKGQPYIAEGADVAATFISWDDATAFCEKLTRRERKAGKIHHDQEYRLPTEAEWECACRAGTTTYWSFGRDAGLAGEYAWFGGGWNEKTGVIPGGNTASEQYAHRVKDKKPNAWGFFDMHGNVWEWTSDWHGEKPKHVLVDPRGPSAGTYRTVRGGGWLGELTGASFSGWQAGRLADVGFRVVLSIAGNTSVQAAMSDSTQPSSVAPPLAMAPFDAAQARVHQETWAKHLGIEVETTNSIGQALVLVPPGTFTMGEGPGLVDVTLVDVTLTKPFLLGQTEVTQGQWREVMGTEPWKGQTYTAEGADVAATFISWDDATAFCEKLTRRERNAGTIGLNQQYRLPTEAEWEFACRAGTVTAYSFSDNESRLGDHAFFGGGWDQETNSPKPGGNTASEMYAHAVGLKNPNPFGLFDVHANVWEWCSDWSGGSAATDPHRASRASNKVRRGGSWGDTAVSCQSGYRYGNHQLYRDCFLGFRIALSPLGAKPTEMAMPTIGAFTSPRIVPPTAISPFDATRAREYQEAWAKHLGIEVETTNSIGQALVLIPPATFTMGERDETREITISQPFLIGQTEVTQKQWRDVMGTQPWQNKPYTVEDSETAVTYVSWYDAKSFCLRLTTLEREKGVIGAGQHYRLPTEAEWECACRAGTSAEYYFGDDEGLLEEFGWFGGGWDPILAIAIPGGNSADSMHPRKVQIKLPNAWRLYDMHGNVTEWVSDWFSTLPRDKAVDPYGPTVGTLRSRRGGSWVTKGRFCQSGHRISLEPSGTTGELGFRVSLSPILTIARDDD